MTACNIYEIKLYWPAIMCRSLGARSLAMHDFVEIAGQEPFRRIAEKNSPGPRWIVHDFSRPLRTHVRHGAHRILVLIFMEVDLPKACLDTTARGRGAGGG